MERGAGIIFFLYSTTNGQCIYLILEPFLLLPLMFKQPGLLVPEDSRYLVQVLEGKLLPFL